MTGKQQSWVIFDKSGDTPIPNYTGPDYRFPYAMAKYIIERFCPEGGAVLDPFAGFGTSCLAANELGRRWYGFEKNAETYAAALESIKGMTQKFLNDDIHNIFKHNIEPVDLIFTSPPYASFRSTMNDPEDIYFEDFEEIFSRLKKLLKPTGKLVVEIANVHDNRGSLPLAFLAATILRKHYKFEYEIINCEAGNTCGGGHYDHSYILVFSY